MNPAAVELPPPADAADRPVERVVRVELSAHDAFERGMGAWGVQRRNADDDRDDGIILYDRLLIEDDGPGIGSDAVWQREAVAATFKVAGSNRIKKILHIDRPAAMAAWLFVRPGATVEINGRRLTGAADGEFAEVPVDWLRQGDNEVVLIARGESGPSIKLAARQDILRNAPDRAGRPARSFISSDDGRTWQTAGGEFMVRLHLLQYAPGGNFISPVLDLAKTDSDDSVLQPAIAVRSVSVHARAQTPPLTQVQISIRTGSAPVYEPSQWSDWRPAPASSPAAPGHRYLQWKATLTSQNPTATPVVERVIVEATVLREPRPNWASAIAVGECVNPDIRYTSIPFAYEDPQHPRMVALRQKYRLDEVVAGAKSEIEKFVRLRDWVMHQWKFTVPEEFYPGWDADEILSSRVGFCVHYAIVCMQAAISLGFQARYLFGANPGAIGAFLSHCNNPDVRAILPPDADIGHEVCEVWSNEHAKWIYLDVSENFHCVDARTGVPLSMGDVHELILKTYYPDGEIVRRANAPREDKTSENLGICYNREVSPQCSAEKTIDGRYPVPRLWMFLRYMPRNNFLAQPDPVPIRQGAHFDWTGFVVLEGRQMPKGQWQYGHFTGRRADLGWTINQVRFDASYGDAPGVVRIQMGTVTPGFETFIAKIGDEDWKATTRSFDWPLRRGRNRLQMRVRNTSGALGPIGLLEINYEPRE